jgi:hypothetical protein
VALRVHEPLDGVEWIMTSERVLLRRGSMEEHTLTDAHTHTQTGISAERNIRHKHIDANTLDNDHDERGPTSALDPNGPWSHPPPPLLLPPLCLYLILSTESERFVRGL